jgi:hypothetical protein
LTGEVTMCYDKKKYFFLSKMFNFSNLMGMVTPDMWIFFTLLWVFLISRYFLRNDIAKKEHKSQVVSKTKEVYFYLWVLWLAALYTFATYFKIEFLSQMATLCISLFIVYIVSLLIHRKILLLYGEEVEAAWQKYFKKWYKVSLFSLFVNVACFFIGVFLCIEIFQLNSIIQIGGLWAWILAFMWFTASVWALDMIAWIILLQSSNYESGNVFYIYDLKKYVWLKSISLTEVKLIDLRTGNPILFRPSKFRDLTVKNISLWIVGKTSKVLCQMDIKIWYHIRKDDIAALCYDAFDTLQVDILAPETTNYFWEEPYRELLIENFWDYAVEYKFFYTLSSPFYIFKAERLLNEYFLTYQQERNIFFATPDLLELQKKESF